MRAKEIHFNGGPLHDKTIAMPEDFTHIHVREFIPLSHWAEHEDDTIPEPRYREGIYSQVSGYPGEFEWDGWNG